MKEKQRLIIVTIFFYCCLLLLDLWQTYFEREWEEKL